MISGFVTCDIELARLSDIIEAAHEMDICLLWLVIQSSFGSYCWFQFFFLVLAGQKYITAIKRGYKLWISDELPHPLHLVSSDKQQKDHKSALCVIGDGFSFVFCLSPVCNYVSLTLLTLSALAVCYKIHIIHLTFLFRFFLFFLFCTCICVCQSKQQ